MPASYEAEEVTPFAMLTEYLETTIEHAEGPVSLPDELVTQFRDATIQDDSGIGVWTRILGTSDHTNRFRLDYAAFNNVVAILLHLPYSHQQERLLFAFISTIELIKDTKVTRVALARIKYIHSTVEYVETLRHKIHNKLVHKMMRVLIIANAEDSMRRMAAHILFALVRTNIDAPEIVRRLIEVQNLGPLVDKDDDYLLRLFTANIVRELCVCGMELHEFWPQSPKKKRQKHEDFPLAPAPTSEWIRQITDYLSTRDTSRGFHGDSQHLVSGLLSIDTGSFAFTDRPRGNILAVLSDKCSIVVPGTVSTPLTLLELVLDPKCNYDLDETTSPDFRPDLGDEVIVHIDTGRRGYQVSKGVRNTMDNAELVFSNYGQGRVFADSANLVLTALPPLPRRETSIPGDELSSRQEGRSFRRLNVGMVDLSERSDVEDGVMSDSDVDSLINMRSPFDEQRLRGSQSRYSSRVTQAKLKEASRNQRSKSASFPREGLLRLGDQGSPATPSQSIDPKVLLTRKDEPIPMRPSRSETTTAMPGGNTDRTLSMNVDFASYVDQESHRHPNLSPLGNGTTGDGNRSEGNAKPLPSQNSSPQHSPLLYESDLDPASPVSPLTSRKSAWEKSRGTSARPPPPPLLPRSRAQKSKQRREHSQLQAVLNQYSQTPQNGKTTLVTTRRGSNPVDTAPGTEKRLSASKPSVQTSLKRPQKSQPSASHGIDWDVREMAGEDTSAPLTKKPKLGNEAPKQTGRAGEAQLKPDEDPIQIENSGMKSTLQRPKNFIKSSQGLQKKTQPARNHDEFELNADDDEEDSTMPVPKSKQNTTKQVGKTTSQKPKSAASQPPKVVQKKKGAKSRTALKAVNPNTATLASTRARREQPKSSKYVESTDSEPDVKSNQRTEKKIDMAKRDTEESATGKSANDAPRLVMENNADDGHMFEEDRISTEASLLSFGEQSKSLTDSAFPEALKEVHHAMLEQNSVQDRPRSMKIAEESDHHRQVQQHSQAATPKYEILVTASPTRSEKRRTRGQVRELGDRSDLRSERNTNSQDSQAEVGEDHGDPPDQTAESSYPIARSAVQDPRLSFGSKLGQYIQKVAPLRQDTSTAAPQATSISNAKSFITAVKTARSVSPVKKSAVSTTTTGTKRKATQHKRPTTRAPKKGATTKETTGTLILTRSPKAQISSPKLPKATDFAGVAYYGHTTAEQVEQPQQERDVLPTTANVLNSYNNDYAHLNILAAIEHQDTTNTIDLTHDSDEETPSTTGDHLDLNLRGDPSTSRDRTVTIPKIQPSVPKVDKKTSREVMKPKAVKNQAAETKHHATSQATTAKTPSISATRAKRMSLSTLKTLLPKNETPTTLEKSTQKVQIVHFGKQGPQNQGVSSPSKESLSSDAAVRRPSGTRKHQAYNKRGTITAAAHTFRNPPKLEPDAAETASDIDLDEQRIIANDLEDVDESVQSEHAAVSPEEGAGELVPHLPDEVENVSKSASQASRVDENGGPRLQSQEDVELSGWFSPELEAFPHTEVKRYNHAENDSVSPQGMSEIAESSMEDTDTSLHLIRDRPLLHRSDRSIRTQATSKVASISKASQPARRQPAPATMNTKRAPRESLGLNEAVQGQYPKAEKKITTSLFKKSEPKTTAPKTLGTSPTLPMNNRQSTGEATDRARQPLTEKSINTEMPNGVQILPPPPILAHARSAAATIHVKKSYTKLPHPTSPSEVSECTSASLRPSLRARQTKSVADKEFTILENLERGKSVHREAENADVTLVEDSNRGRMHYQQRCPDSSVDSTSPSFWDERCGNFYDERKVWNKGSRVTQTSVREALMEIANNVLFRLETEEKAIELKVNNFAAGGSSILRRYEKTTDELFDHGAKKLVKNARKKRRELESAFNNLELKKTSIREASSSEPAQGHFNANQSSMAKRLKAMIRAEKEQASDDEVDT